MASPASTPAATSSTPAPTPTVAATSVPSALPTYGSTSDTCRLTENYLVEPGDTLTGIAAEYGLRVAALIAANPQIADPNLIRVGEWLSIPVITELGTLGGTNIRVAAINERGEVVGTSHLATPNVYHAFHWHDGVMTDLGTLGGHLSQATDVNDDGEVVGTSTATDAPDARWRAVLWHDGVPRDLGTLGGPTAMAVAINDRGEIVGTTSRADGNGGGFIWQDGVMTDLGTLGGRIATVPTAINDVGQVVGAAHTAAGEQHAFLWQKGVMTDLGTLGGTWSFAHDVNDRGQVVGVSSLEGGFEGPKHAFLWERGVMTDLGIMGTVDSLASAINNKGQIVGWGRQADGYERAFLWAPGGAMTAIGIEGGRSAELTGLNDRGQFVGLCLARFEHAFVTEVLFAPGISLDSPSSDTAVVQNDPSTGCSAHATRGYGFRATFSWTSRMPQRATRYRLVVRHAEALNAALDITIPDPAYTWTSCNGFVIGPHLTGWHWQVTAFDAANVPIAVSESRPLRFLACELADGSACNAPPD